MTILCVLTILIIALYYEFKLLTSQGVNTITKDEGDNG
jgi:hypothetical protein